ncbi:MAG: hypothetical protein WC787_05125 [Patescibacteria group bacterium]|jgi:hypothetical protein
MQSRTLIRLEWISLVYLALFVLAVLSPSLVTRGFLGIDERHVEEFLIFLFGIVGLATFSIYQRIMERKEKEHEDAKTEYERAKRELVESYKYIGAINRQIEVLKRVTNQTSLNIVGSDHFNKDLLTSLLANAAACVGAKTALIRYVELEKLRTNHEVLHSLDGTHAFKVPNRELKKLHDAGASHAFIRSDDGQEILVIPSDHEAAAVKAFLLIVPDAQHASAADTTLLKVFANQAQLLHYTLEGQSKTPQNPLELVKETKRQVVGEVS